MNLVLITCKTNPSRRLALDVVTVQTGLITTLFAMINLTLYLAIVNTLSFILCLSPKYQY